MTDDAQGSWFGIDPEVQRKKRRAEIERITANIARLKAGKPDADRLAALERDLDILQTIEKFS
jgi:hypothetical protein